MFDQLSADARGQLFRELFHPSEMGLNVCRLCIGSSDYATKVYSYDEGAPDPDLTRFSIDHDRAYILPILKEARGANPDLFLLGSPWSPPGWMKGVNSMLGGSMPKTYFSSYANYLVKFLRAYADAGVPVNAVTVQNEVDTNQDGHMPACQWGQEYEVEFVGKHLGPQFEQNQLNTKIWLIDHNYNLWGRAICELDDPLVQRYADGIAWHGYLGEPSAMTRVHEAHPNKHAYWTEGGPAYNSPTYETDWTRWSTTYAGILRNWARCIIGWNLALDEVGKPNIGPFNCGGLVTINSKTKEVTRSGQYWAFAHYSRAIRRGAKRVESSAEMEGVAHAAFVNTDGSFVAVLTNSGPARESLLRMAGMEATVSLPENSITTLSWKA
jgi:glucosylceramidase